MKQVKYKDWMMEFKALTEKYISSIDWESIIYSADDFGAVSDDLQNDAYVKAHMKKFNDDNYDLTEWVFYDESCVERTEFKMNLKDKWADELEKRENNA